jgi:hypothetical protein
MLNIAMAEVRLQGAGILPIVGQRVAAAVPEHMRMRFEG